MDDRAAERRAQALAEGRFPRAGRTNHNDTLHMSYKAKG
jgi:hypothetical protein